MIDKKLVLGGFLGGIGLGAAIVSGGLRDFVEGFLGIPSESSTPAVAEFKAELASPILGAPLRTEQLEELFQGLAYLLNDEYPSAVPILRKYALLGDKRAQSAIGSMHYFGMGLPLDREQGVRWFRLAAAQGDHSDNETLSAAVNGSLEWETSEGDNAFASTGNARTVSQYDSRGFAPSSPHTKSITDFGRRRIKSSAGQSDIPMGARSSVDETYGSASASRRYLDTYAPPPEANNGLRQAGSASPIILNRAGPGTYSDASGDIYTQAGPHGVVNTRTGEFSPTN